MGEIGVVGLGNAGRPLALRLLGKGRSVRVYDMDEKAMAPLVAAGAEGVSSPAKAACAWTLTVLPGPRDVEKAVFGDSGIMEGLPPGGILIDVSGIDPPTTARVSAALQERGANLVSCSLHASGAPALTIPEGTLCICAGAARPVLENVLPLLQDLAMTVVCVPDPAIPKLMKISINMLGIANHIVATEVALLLTSQGIDPAILCHVMKETGSSTPTTYLNRILRGGLKAGGNIRNTHKDLALALQLAGEQTLPLPFTSMAEQILQMGRARGMDGTDLPESLVELYNTITGQSLRKSDLPPEQQGPQLHEPRVVWLGFER